MESYGSHLLVQYERCIQALRKQRLKWLIWLVERMVESHCNPLLQSCLWFFTLRLPDTPLCQQWVSLVAFEMMTVHQTSKCPNAIFFTKVSQQVADMSQREGLKETNTRTSLERLQFFLVRTDAGFGKQWQNA